MTNDGVVQHLGIRIANDAITIAELNAQLAEKNAEINKLKSEAAPSK